MEYYYFDTCAIVNLFIETEKGHSGAKSIYDNPNNHIIISELSNLEFVSALNKKLSTFEIIQTQYNDIRRHFARLFTDCVESGKVMFLSVDSDIYSDAVDLIVKHNLRTLDSIQLQTVIPFSGLNPFFVTSDNKLASAASNYFRVINLNNI